MKALLGMCVVAVLCVFGTQAAEAKGLVIINTGEDVVEIGQIKSEVLADIRAETAPDVKLGQPRCGTQTCEADAYCVRDACVARARRPGGGALPWVLGIGGGVLGLVVVGVGATAVARRRKARPTAPPPPPVVAATAAPPAPAAPAAPPGGPVLIVMSGPEAGRQVPLHHGFSLGKAPGHHLSLAHDGTASSNHAQVTFDGQAWTLTDLGSTNGTFANGNRITSVRLFPGMTIRLGSTEVRFWQP